MYSYGLVNGEGKEVISPKRGRKLSQRTTTLQIINTSTLISPHTEQVVFLLPSRKTFFFEANIEEQERDWSLGRLALCKRDGDY